MRNKKRPEIGNKREIRKAGSIIEKLKGRSPSLSELDEWDETEPPEWPTYGGVALEEQIKAARKKGKYPYLPE